MFLSEDFQSTLGEWRMMEGEKGKMKWFQFRPFDKLALKKYKTLKNRNVEFIEEKETRNFFIRSFLFSALVDWVLSELKKIKNFYLLPHPWIQPLQWRAPHPVQTKSSVQIRTFCWTHKTMRNVDENGKHVSPGLWSAISAFKHSGRNCTKQNRIRFIYYEASEKNQKILAEKAPRWHPRPTLSHSPKAPAKVGRRVWCEAKR